MDALNSTNVTVVEGEDVDISCLASANPLPSDIVWTFAGDSTSFSQTDTTENKTAYITSAGTFSFSEGNITSTLHITAAEYPTNDGVYTCTSTSDTTTLKASITVNVQGGVLLWFVYHVSLTPCLFSTVPPLVVPVISDVIGNENMNATLQFRIDNAHPRVLLSELRWFYSEQLVNSISQQGTVEEITNRTNRTSESQLVTSFSSDGVYFNITVVNIAQERLGGEGTDRGRYFLQATNPAGSSVAFIDLEVYGTLMNCQMWWLYYYARLFQDHHLLSVHQWMDLSLLEIYQCSNALLWHFLLIMWSGPLLTVMENQLLSSPQLQETILNIVLTIKCHPILLVKSS